MGAASSKKEPQLIVVFGALGNQGSSVVAALKVDSKYKVRAVTRNTESDKAKALAELGVEVVSASYEDPESLKAALTGAYGAFVVTTFWEEFDKDKEIQQGKSLADACKECNVQHVVFSGLEYVEEVECLPMQSKAEIAKYMKSIDLPVTVAIYALYYENLLGAMKPQKAEDGVYYLGMAMEGKPLAMISVVDSGECIHGIFRQGKKLHGKDVILAGHNATVDEYADIMTNTLKGMTFKAANMTAEQFGQQEFQGAEIYGTLFAAFQRTKRDTAEARKLHRKLMDFKTWLNKNKDSLQEEPAPEAEVEAEATQNESPKEEEHNEKKEENAEQTTEDNTENKTEE